MNNLLTEYLLASGAQTATDGSPDFAPLGAAASDILVSRSDLVVLRVSGADAADFLQGQFSNDVAQLADGGAQLTTWSNPKGRVLALFQLIRSGDDFYIALPSGLADNFVKRLRMYVLRAAVVVEPLADHACIAVSGEPAAQQFAKAPAAPGQCVSQGQLAIVRVRGQLPRFEIIGPVDDLHALWKELAAVSAPAARADWRLQDIEAGVPSIVPATSEAFVLQMLNLQLIDGVSFKKGCFPGQEVVARMQYLGKLKRRMYRASLASDEAPAAGADIHRSGGGSAVGKVVAAAQASPGVCHLLAVLAIDATDEPLYCDGFDAPLALLDLPYQIEAA